VQAEGAPFGRRGVKDHFARASTLGDSWWVNNR
jgi:hypothetical protein